MPELPDLEVICEYLRPRLLGASVESSKVLRPLVFRDLSAAGLDDALSGRPLSALWRRGKFLIFAFQGAFLLAINPMLAGRLVYCDPARRREARTYMIFCWSNGKELRYVDPRAMGKVYLARRLEEVPTLAETGPEALAEEVTLEVFTQRLRGHHGEVKGILTDHRFLAGIGNAYADEILFQAGIYPFRKRRSLSCEETARLYQAVHTVLQDALSILRARMGEDIHIKIRDFLQVHLHGGEPCPRCGTPISEIKSNQRVTSFCRSCQPGSLIRG